ncbi:hypothetical protein AUC43_18805 [Hymenobacter sedentarius]|uniref:Uncharacterized protein n=1 Tax=Hymenobacter sedentarius TaxID=1411621 RepID=A0A0U3T1Z8_9BACT|nr:hypothetical protein AUC43_18805 [Hymenobacter sedentarius]
MNARRIQVNSTRRIVQITGSSKMAGTIQFYRKLFLRTVKIKNKLTNAVLAAEFTASKLAAF